jgi:competence protein ComEA
MKLPELKTWQSILFGMVLGAAILAAVVLISLPDRMSPLVILPTVTVSPIKIHITGAITNPGVVNIPVNSRIQDAINAAGGVTDEADLAPINLAAVVTDGQKIIIPILGETLDQNSVTVQKSSSDGSLLISLNSADQKELEKLPGIGEEKAKAIIAERDKRGRFQFVDDLSDIPGFTQNLLNQIRPFLYIE